MFALGHNGRLLNKTDASGTTTYAWDFENRLKQATLPNGKVVTYKYDALGRRIERTASVSLPLPLSTTTRFTYDGADVIQDKDGNGLTTASYLNGPGIDDKLRQSGTTGVFYFTTDHLGSTRALTSAAGIVLEQEQYDSFGNSTASQLTRYGYTGRERDPDIGLLYYRARFYDPQVGRFISEDPAGFVGGLNFYGYVANDPLNFTDPTGQWETPAHEYIIDEAFKHCLSKAQQQRLKDASGYIDGLFNGGQSEHYAYQHGMRGGSGQSEREARDAADNFIKLHEQNARNLAPKGCEGGYQKISGDALYEFGQALHTITDMTSPAHEGFQIWNGPPYPSLIPGVAIFQAIQYARYVGHHHQQETLDVLKSDPVRFERIKQAAREAFAKTFGDCGCCSN